MHWRYCFKKRRRVCEFLLKLKSHVICESKFKSFWFGWSWNRTQILLGIALGHLVVGILHDWASEVSMLQGGTSAASWGTETGFATMCPSPSTRCSSTLWWARPVDGATPSVSLMMAPCLRLVRTPLVSLD